MFTVYITLQSPILANLPTIISPSDLLVLQKSQQPIGPVFLLGNHETFSKLLNTSFLPTKKDTVPVDSSGRPKPFVCHHPGCDKCYYKSSHLKAHHRTHTGRLVEFSFIIITIKIVMICHMT